MKRYTLFGTFISVIWLSFTAFLLYSKWPSISGLTLNEWGDFFAGMMAPLAFFWLVLGYIQQGDELRLNTEALKAQQEELRRQVKETAALVAQSERQAAAAEKLALATMSESQRAALKEAMEAMPVFLPAGGTTSGASISIRVKNVGATVKDLSVSSSIDIRINPKNLFETGTEGWLQMHNVTAWPFLFSISYTDILNNKHTKQFEMREQMKFVEIETT